MDVLEFESLFESFIVSSSKLSDRRLREAVLKQPISVWNHSYFWDWKQKNYELFGDFIVRSVRSLEGSESILLPEELLSNLELTIPWYDENSAELCTLLMEEFAVKQIKQVTKSIDYTWDSFCHHPDFGEDKETILADLKAFKDSLHGLRFPSLDAYLKD